MEQQQQRSDNDQQRAAAVAVRLGMMEQQQQWYSSTSGAMEQQQPSSSGTVPTAAEQQTQKSSSSRARENPVGNSRSAAATAADPTNPTDTVRPFKSARTHPPLPPTLRRYHNPAFAPPRSYQPPTPEELQELDLPSNTSSPCSSPSTSPARYDTKLGDYVKTDENGNDLT